MHIVEDVIDRELEELSREGVQLRHIGRLERLSPVLQAKVKQAIEHTHNNQRLILNIAFNYGGRDEIVCAVRAMFNDQVDAGQITEDLISQYLFTSGVPDPDLIIRTSGEMRISNFLIWQSAYSEWYVTDTLWPDFNREHLMRALQVYEQRDRRYGRLSTGECQ